MLCSVNPVFVRGFHIVFCYGFFMYRYSVLYHEWSPSLQNAVLLFFSLFIMFKAIEVFKSSSSLDVMVFSSFRKRLLYKLTNSYITLSIF